MRRLITAVACAVFVLILAVPALAAGQLQFTVTPSVTLAAPGETVTFEVSVRGGAYSSIGYIPTYDNSIWEFVNGECLMDYTGLGGFSRSDGGIMSFADPVVRDGAVFGFTMKVKADAPAGQTAVTGIVAAKDGSNTLNTSLDDAVVTIQAQSAVESTQTATTKPVEQTVPTKPMEETTQQTRSAPDATFATASSEATNPVQGTAQDATVPKETEKPIDAEDSVLTIGQGSIPNLGGDNSCVADDWDDGLEAEEPVPKDNDTLLVWIAAIAVVAVCAAAACFFLRKKKTE